MSIQKRKHIRLSGYDYSKTGYYFVTICVARRECLFGEIKNDVMELNSYGVIVGQELERTADVRSGVFVDQYVVMPNHVHLVIVIQNDIRFDKRATQRVAPTTTLMSGSLGAVVGQLKSVIAKKINSFRKTTGQSVWQRSFYDHVIRNDADYARICEYIENNPMQWALDEENPEFLNKKGKFK